jgi:hypothetical protein
MSLAEMLVVVAITGMLVLGTATVLISLTRHAGIQAGRPPRVGGRTDVALEAIERDLQLARAIPADAGGLPAGFLLVERADGELVTWRQQGQHLLRGTVDEEHELHERTVADALLLFDAQRAGPRLVDVTLRRREEPVRRRSVLLRNLEEDAP